MDLLWGSTRALERCDAPGWTAERNTHTEDTRINDILKFYEAPLENIWIDCQESAFTTSYEPFRSSPGGDIGILARLINASRDRKVSDACSSFSFTDVRFLSLSLSVSRSH